MALKQRTPRTLDEVVRRGDMVVSAHEKLPVDERNTHWSIINPSRPGTAEAFDRVVGLTDLSQPSEHSNEQPGVYALRRWERRGRSVRDAAPGPT